MLNDFEEKIKTLAKKRRAKILIGLYQGRMSDSIAKSIQRAQKEIADVTVVGACVDGVECVPAGPEMEDIHDKMVEVIKQKKIEGIVRGNVEEHGLLRKLKTVFTPTLPENELRIQNPGVMVDISGRTYIIGPTSTVWGRNDREKKLWVDSSIRLLKEFGYDKPKLGFLTSIRKANYKKTTVENEDTLWSYKTWESAENLVEHYKKKGYEAKNYEIHVEHAVAHGCDIICLAEGPMGNALCRGLMFLGGARYIAGPRMALGIPYEDDSQSEQDYYPHVLFAAAWVNGKKEGKIKM